MANALLSLIVLVASALQAANEPMTAHVGVDPLGTVTKDVWLAKLTPVPTAALRVLSQERNVEGARCRLIGWCVKRHMVAESTAGLSNEAVVGVWLADGSVALMMLTHCLSDDEGQTVFPWDQPFRFVPDCAYGAPEYVSAKDLERDRAVVGKFLRTTEFGYYGVGKDTVLSLALDREWLSDAVVADVVKGLSGAGKENRRKSMKEFVDRNRPDDPPWDRPR